MNIYKTITLILTLFIQINASDFFLSFSILSYNNSLINARLDCSKALTNINRKKIFLFKLENVNNSDVVELCKKRKEEILDNLLKSDVIFYSNEKVHNKIYFGRKKLTYLPHRFDIIIKNSVAYFYIKGE